MIFDDDARKIYTRPHRKKTRARVCPSTLPHPPPTRGGVFACRLQRLSDSKNARALSEQKMVVVSLATLRTAVKRAIDANQYVFIGGIGGGIGGSGGSNASSSGVSMTLRLRKTHRGATGVDIEDLVPGSAGRVFAPPTASVSEIRTALTTTTTPTATDVKPSSVAKQKSRGIGRRPRVRFEPRSPAPGGVRFNVPSVGAWV